MLNNALSALVAQIIMEQIEANKRVALSGFC
jgi:hypothetical protein